MPKFLDAPSWYSSNGSQVHGLGSQSSSGFPGNIPEGLVLGLSTIEGASNNGVEGQTYLLPLAPTDATPTSPNQYKGRIAVIAGEASYSSLYMSTQPVYRKLYQTMVWFKRNSFPNVTYLMYTTTWGMYNKAPTGTYTMQQWKDDFEVENYFKGPFWCDTPDTEEEIYRGKGIYASIEGNTMCIYGYSGTGLETSIVWDDSLTNLTLLRAWSEVPAGL